MIKCRVANHKSNLGAAQWLLPSKAVLKQAEYLNGAYDDQNIYGRIIDSPSS